MWRPFIRHAWKERSDRKLAGIESQVADIRVDLARAGYPKPKPPPPRPTLVLVDDEGEA